MYRFSVYGGECLNKKKLAALIIAFAVLLCGCSTPNDTVTVPENTLSCTESEAVKETEVTPPTETENVTEAASKSETDSKATELSKEMSAETEETTTESETAAEEETEQTEETTEKTTKETIVSTTTAATTTTTAATTEATVPPTETATDPPPVTTTTAAPETTAAAPAPPSPATVLAPVADGALTESNALATIDYSHTSDGYVMAKYTGSVAKIKVQILTPSGVKQTYDLKSDGTYEAYPLTGSNGTYTITVLEHVSGKNYALANTLTFEVNLSNALAPFLRPSQYVNYSAGDSAVTLASQLCGGAANVLEKVDRIYTWLVDNVVYDYDFAASDIAGGYAGDTYKVVNQKKGICLDYAATMAAMLRSQNVPTQVISGNVTDGGFRAWVNVYVQDVGWVYAGAIYFDGSGWKRMDPTYAASSKSSQQILDFIANGNNYTTKYIN